MKAHAKRSNRADYFEAAGMGSQTMACSYAMAPFDNAAREMDAKWGVDRLPALVATSTATRYGHLMTDLSEALSNENAEKVAELCTIGIRALAAMDAEATQAGATAHPQVWEYNLEGFKFGIVPDDTYWHHIKRERPDLVIFTMREAALAIQAFEETSRGFLTECKKNFEKAEAVAIRKAETLPADFFESGGDPIPF